MGKIRKAYNAGSWYRGDAASLKAEIKRFIPADAEPQPALAITCPHAGHTYSGPVLGAVTGATVIPERVVVLAVNHVYPRPPLFGVWPDGTWETPLGEIPVDAELTAAVLEKCPGAVAHTAMHEPVSGRAEHSGEILLPFFRYHNPGVRTVVIGCAAERLEEMQAFGKGLAEAVQSVGGGTLIAISMDLSHEDGNIKQLQENDDRAISRILNLDEEGFLNDVRQHGITTCGRSTLPAGLAAAKALGATGAELVKRATSADVTGDCRGYVVGYAGIRIF